MTDHKDPPTTPSERPSTDAAPPPPLPSNPERSEANSCIALGAGVGALGALGTALSGAVCPLCVVVAPALIGIGVYKRVKERGSKGK